MIDLDIVTEFNLYNIIFAKDQLGLDDDKTVILVNMLLAVLRNNNKRHLIKSKKLGPQEIDAVEYLESLYNKEEDPFKEHNANLQLREKTVKSDLDFFMKLIRNHCSNNPPSQV